MKKFLLISTMVAGLLFFTGCSNDDDVIIVDPGPGPGPGPGYVTLFLIDSLGYGVQYVPYVCYAPDGAVVADDVTWANGEFTFIPGDRCEFDLFGFDGSIVMPLFIADDLGYGKIDIPYECDNGDLYMNGFTDYDGFFEYPIDAYCTFYL